VCPMHPSAILHDVQQLYNVRDSLDSLAEQHPLVSETLIKISGSVSSTATSDALGQSAHFVRAWTKEKSCFFASNIGWAGIAFGLLATGMLVQALPQSPADSSNKEGAPAFFIRNEIKKIQESLRDKGHYRGKVDGVVGLRTRASIRAYQKAENITATGQVDTRTADGLGVRPESIWGNSKSTGHDVANGGGRTGGKISRDKPSAGIGWVDARSSKTSRKVDARATAIEDNGGGRR
jgi:hypothetical protein